MVYASEFIAILDRQTASNKTIVFNSAQYCISTLVDGNFGNWTKSSPCSVTCGQGVEIWTRQCDNPPGKYGGNCSSRGAAQENRRCEMDPCPGRTMKIYLFLIWINSRQAQDSNFRAAKRRSDFRLSAWPLNYEASTSIPDEKIYSRLDRSDIVRRSFAIVLFNVIIRYLNWPLNDFSQTIC